MADEIATERSPARKGWWAGAVLIITWLGAFGAIGFLASSCGEDTDLGPTRVTDGDGRYDYDGAWHEIKVTGSDGTTHSCVVNNFKEGVWCK